MKKMVSLGGDISAKVAKRFRGAKPPPRRRQMKSKIATNAKHSIFSLCPPEPLQQATILILPEEHSPLRTTKYNIRASLH